MRHPNKNAQMEVQAFGRLAPMDRVPVSALQMTFFWDYAEYRLEGYDTSSAVHPYVATRLSDGERRQFSAGVMHLAFGEVRRQEIGLDSSRESSTIVPRE